MRRGSGIDQETLDGLRTDLHVIRAALVGFRSERDGYDQLINFRLHLVDLARSIVRPCDYEGTDIRGMRPIDYAPDEGAGAARSVIREFSSEVAGRYLDGATTDRVIASLRRFRDAAEQDVAGIGDEDTRSCVSSVFDKFDLEYEENEKSYPTFRLLVLTALGIELEAVLALADRPYRRRGKSGLRYECGVISGHSMLWDTRIAEMGPGNVNAAVLATKAIEESSPNLLAMVGIAGSLRCEEVPPGDVVIADRVYHYEGRVEDPLPRARPISYSWTTPIGQAARAAARLPADEGSSSPIRIHVKPIAAGETLLKSKDSMVAELLHEHFSDAVAIDMESSGVYAAVHSSGSIPTLAIRGISDCLEDKTYEQDVQRQPRAAKMRPRLFIGY